MKIPCGLPQKIISGKKFHWTFFFLHFSLSGPFILKPTTNWDSTLLKFRSNRTKLTKNLIPLNLQYSQNESCPLKPKFNFLEQILERLLLPYSYNLNKSFLHKNPYFQSAQSTILSWFLELSDVTLVLKDTIPSPKRAPCIVQITLFL